MIIIKLWWSVFAPKNSHFFDRDYLLSFYTLVKSFWESVFFIHWAGNVWHSFVKQNGLNKESYSLWKKNIRNNLWNPFSEIFPDFQRIEIEDLLIGKIDTNALQGNYIVGWDISSDFQILSGDDAFSFIMKKIGEKKGYMVTDIAWILDGQSQLIETLNIWDLSKIQFWKKEWDVQNSMFTKVSSIKKYLEGTGSTVWIMHGNNLNNVQSVINTGVWVGTKIVL
jgi:isopentenyl phosphate kinase